MPRILPIVASGLGLLFSTDLMIPQSVLAAHSQFSCKGSLIEPSGFTPSEITVRLDLDLPNRVLLDLGEGTISGAVISNNSVQLKFSTENFLGEFFHYTNELILIYVSKHLARLTCSP